MASTTPPGPAPPPLPLPLPPFARSMPLYDDSGLGRLRPGTLAFGVAVHAKSTYKEVGRGVRACVCGGGREGWGGGGSRGGAGIMGWHVWSQNG